MPGTMEKDLNAADIDGDTCFILACTEGRKEVVKSLLELSDSKNIDLNARTNDGRTAFVCLRRWTS